MSAIHKENTRLKSVEASDGRATKMGPNPKKAL